MPQLLDQCFQQKSVELHSLRVENFQARNGWIESFRTRRSINFGYLSGESGGIDMESVEDWKANLQQVINQCPLSNEFNAKEMELFYRQMTKKSSIQKGEYVKMRKF
jgi:hypothetical protein